MGVLEIIILSLALLLAVASLIVGLWSSFVYIKLSWSRRENSRGFNGIEAAEATLDKQGSDIKVGKSFWNLSYVRYSKSSRTLKLGPINSKRKSLWTVATSGRQAYAAHILDTGRHNDMPISGIWFRLQTFWVGVFMSFLFNTLITISLVMMGLSIQNGNSVLIWVIVLIAIIAFFSILMATAVLKTTKIMYEDAEQIYGGIFTEDEVEKIKKLWKLEYINAIIELLRTLVNILLLILIIFSRGENK